MHYVDEGQGETLLMVHGNPTWSFAWRNLIKDFSADYRVIAIDHIGCGFSDKPPDYPYILAQHIANLRKFVTELELEKVTLFGHDWGGAIGLGTVVQMPDRFARINLSNTAAFRSKQIPARIAVCRVPLFGRFGVQGMNLFSRAALSMAVEKPERMTAAVKAGYLAPYHNWQSRVAVMRFVQDIPLNPRHPSYRTLVEVEDGLATLTDKPMLLTWGENDWCFTPAFREEFKRRFPDAQSIRFEDAGHYIFEDAHERMIPAIREFLQQHPIS